MKKTLFLLFALINLSAFSQTYVTSTIAGGATFGNVDANGINARFNFLGGIEFINGEIFVTESSFPRVRKIDANQNVTTIAGDGIQGNVNGSALNARFNSPLGIIKDNNGNIYICDRFNDGIRKIDSNFNVTILSGSSSFGGTGGYADGPIGENVGVGYNRPTGICFDLQGNLIIADSQNYKIRKINFSTNQVTTIAGSTQGIQDGNATNAKFDFPYDVAVDSQNNIYVVEYQFGKIRKIDTLGNVTTLPNTAYGITGISTDQNDNIYAATSYEINKILPDGTVVRIGGQTGGSFGAGFVDGDQSVSKFTSIGGIDVDLEGNVYVADGSRVRKITYTPATLSCDAATNLTANSGTVNISAINGSAPQSACVLANDAPQLKANWWKFTPSQNGQLLVTSNIPQNNSDTRLRIYSGSCSNLVCVAGNDNISAQNFNSQLSQINLTSGTTYYIVWDNYNTNLTTGAFYYEFTPVTGNAQSCSTAQTLAPYSATVNIGTITGTIPSNGICYNFSQANPNANWWSFTPTQNGLLDITTVTAQNATTVDTRISIFTGTCAALTCFAGSDNISTTDLRSTLNDLILTAGTTYYFVFDDKVSDTAAVNFFYEFTPQTCFRPNTVTFGTPTENTINVNWTAPTVGNTNPSSYTIQIGPRDYVVDSSAALQTIPTLVANSTTITGLTSNTVYDIYIKSNCSASDSSVWYGPFRTTTEFTAVTPSYSENFDSDVSFLFVGWNRSGGTISTLWRTYTGSTPFVSSGTTSIYSPVEPALNTPTNTFAYTRKLNLTAGQNYIVSFMARQFIASGTTTSPSLKVSYTSNLDYTNPATHNQIVNLTNTSATAYTSENHNFSVTNSGQYRIAFKNDVQRTAGTGTAWLMLDSVTVSSALSTENFSKTALQLYPNPVLDDITIQNDDNLEIQTINIVDLKGRVVKEFKYSALNNNLMNISELESGIYIINLITSSQQVLSKKIIKE